MFRLIRPIVFLLCIGAASGAAAQKVPPHEDEWLLKPVDHNTFRTYLEFFRYDSTLPLDVRVVDSRQEEGVTKEHLSFQSTPGVRVTANLYRAAATSGKTPSVVLLHGGGPAGKDSPEIGQTATVLTRAGFQVYAMDLQYFGERGTDMLTTYTEQEKHEHLYNQPSAYLSWVTQTVKDVSRSMDFLVEQRNADPKHIALMGMSRGAILSVIAGAADPRFASVVVFYGGHFDALESGHSAAACPANYIGHISPRPLLMINGTRDTDMIKDSAVEPLYRLAKMPKQIFWSDSGHVNPTEEQRTLMLQWLREKLKSSRHSQQ